MKNVVIISEIDPDGEYFWLMDTDSQEFIGPQGHPVPDGETVKWFPSRQELAEFAKEHSLIITGFHSWTGLEVTFH